MPYKHELANPLGALDILQEDQLDWVKSRLKTYSRKEFGEDEEKFNELKKIRRKELPAATAFTKAVGIDGSLATVEEPSVTVLKIASVWADFTHEPRYVNGILDPSSISQRYRSEFSVGLIPGRDIYPKGKAGSWDTKLREEFYQTLRHMKTHGSSRNLNLVAFLKGQLLSFAQNNPIRCPNCSSERIDFGEINFETYCDACGVDVYFTDYLSPSLFATGGGATTPMLIAEQLLLQSIISETEKGNVADHTIENTLFVADGPLRLYNLPNVAASFTDAIRRYRPRPAIVSFLKSGHIEKIFGTEKAEESLLPGEIALVTEDMRGNKKGAYAKQAASGLYGKSFAYRTENGSKRFGFMLPPMAGDLATGGSPILDEWGNYPALRAVCDFIEANQSNENGPNTATLELIGKANYAASLPAVFSKNALTEIVRSV